MCGQPVWKVGRCLRRHTFCQQRQKVCKKRRLNLRFKDPLARPVPFRPLGCVPHGWECFARGFKCRIIPAMALILQNIRCMFLMFSCRRGHRPLHKKYAPPTFHTVSGSGAGGGDNTKLRPRPTENPLVGRKGSPETIRFLARFWVLFPRGKSAPPEAGQADSTAIPPRKKKQKQDFARPRICSSHASSQNIEPQHHDAEDNQHNPRRAVERLRRGLIREHRRDPRPEEP